MRGKPTAGIAEPGPGRYAATHYPLIGLARHITCGHLLLPGQDICGRRAYQCPACRHPPICAERAHRAFVAAIAQLAPRPARTRPLHQLAGLLACVKLDDHGTVVRLTWRPNL